MAAGGSFLKLHQYRPVGWGGALGAFAPPILAERPVKIQVYSVMILVKLTMQLRQPQCHSY